jgi:hypothetical protein
MEKEYSLGNIIEALDSLIFPLELTTPYAVLSSETALG